MTTAKSLSEQLRAMDWQPIETAPKSGRIEILINENGYIRIAWWGAAAYNRKTKEYDLGWTDGGSYGFKPTHWMPLPVIPGESSLLSSAASALEDAERERDRLHRLVHDNGTPRFNAVCARAEAAEAKLAEAVKVIKRQRQALEKIERTPAWGAPERWDTTPAEVRQLARSVLCALSKDTDHDQK